MSNIKQIQRALQTATDARMAMWNAMGELETVLGFKDGNVPDAVDTHMFDSVGELAGYVISEEQAAEFARDVAEKTPEGWHE